MKLTALALSLTAALALTVSSEASAKSEFGRPGFYVGIGAGGANDFLEQDIEDALGDVINIKGTWSMNARAGYRVWSWLALEAMYEGAYDMAIDETAPPGAQLASMTSHAIYLGPKLIVPIWRFQPYLGLGFGAQHGSFEDVADVLTTDRWDFSFRVGLGLDVYLSENWLINGEVGIPVRAKDYSDLGSAITDNVSITYGGGIQYRF